MAAALKSTMSLTSILSGSDTQNFAVFSGLRGPHGASITTKVTTKTCKKCGAVTASADHSCSSSGSVFASVSTTTSAATPPLIPTVVGAGVLGAAAYTLISGLTKPAAVAPAAITPTAAPPAVESSYIPRAKRAAPAALATMAATFPNAMQEESFVKAVAAELFNLGFTRDNNIALVNTCRDEVCRPLVNLIDREFGLTFNIAGLGGLINSGKTGFKAAMSHSPELKCDKAGVIKERYIFFAFPHVSIGESGEVGSLLRRGRGKSSSACGALIAIKNDISKGGPIVEDTDDAEYVLLKKKVAAKVRTAPGSEGPNLVQVTKAALQAITEDLEYIISKVVDPATCDYAVVTGVQIHSGNQLPGEEFRIERTCDYIAPNAMYAVINGEKHILHCEVNQITAIKSVPADMISV